MNRALIILLIIIVFIGILFYVKNRPPVVTKIEIPQVSPSQPIISLPETKVLEIPAPLKPTTTIQEINLNINENGIDPNEINIKENTILTLKITNTLTTSTRLEIKGENFSTSTDLIEPAKEIDFELKSLNKGEYKIYLKNQEEKEVGKLIIE